MQIRVHEHEHAGAILRQCRTQHDTTMRHEICKNRSRAATCLVAGRFAHSSLLFMHRGHVCAPGIASLGADVVVPGCPPSVI